MLIFDKREIGEKLFALRKRAGLTQSELAELANLSDRAYADIERGEVNMRLQTVLKICDCLHVTPDTFLTEKNNSIIEKEKELLAKLDKCSIQEKETALSILDAYISSLK